MQRSPVGIVLDADQMGSDIDEDLAEYDFILTDMFRPQSTTADSARWPACDMASLKHWKKMLALPSDHGVASAIWKGCVVVRLTERDNLDAGLGLAWHYCVNAVIVPLECDVERLTAFLAGHPECNVLVEVCPNQLESWKILWRTNSHTITRLKAALTLDPHAGDMNHAAQYRLWRSEVLGMVVLQQLAASHRAIPHAPISHAPISHSPISHAPISHPPISHPPISHPALLDFLARCRDDRIPFVGCSKARFNFVAHLGLEETRPYSGEKPFENLLQSPLQPLRDNLLAEAYEVFEEDSIKYRKYTQAITRAVVALNSSKADLCIAVCGAGRGPLVTCLLNVLMSECITPARIFVVEKSPLAMLTIMHKLEDDWCGLDTETIELVLTDMRLWEPSIKIDLIVSELLGGFGDNELSPECLMPLEKHLADRGIMIPASYTSWIEPIYSPKLCKAVHENRTDPLPFETLYTSLIVDAQYPSKPQAVHSFAHPGASEACERASTLTFAMGTDCIVDGFAGYFSADLHGNVCISTCRATDETTAMRQTAGMRSWFPMFFPLSQPIRLEAGANLELVIERRCHAGSVWYTWCVPGHAAHNTNGQACLIKV